MKSIQDKIVNFYKKDLSCSTIVVAQYRSLYLLSKKVIKYVESIESIFTIICNAVQNK